MHSHYSTPFVLVATLVVVVTSFVAQPARAALVVLSFDLTTAQELTLAAGTPLNAAGAASVLYDTDTNTLSWDISFSGLSGSATLAHFHGPADFGVAAGVQVNIGAISGLSSPLSGSTVLTALQETDLLAGVWYINVHTALNPGGEIRGQVISTQDKIGFYRPSTRRYYQDLNGNLTWDAPSGGDRFSAFFAGVGDLPIIGDWNGDGLDEIGFYRPSTRRYYLDLNGNQTWDAPSGGDVFSSVFANSGDIPIIGDWDGDGIDNIGFYRPSTGRYYLDLNGNLSWDAPSGGDLFSASFANSGDEPIIGDWDGDGIDNIGFYRPSTGRYYLDLNGNLSWDAPSGGDVFSSMFANLGDIPIIGDWDGDGIDNIGFYRPSTRRYYLDLNGNQTWDAPSGGDVFSSVFANSGDEPILGKWGIMLSADAPLLDPVSSTTISDRLTLTGTATPGLTVRVYLNGVLVATTVAAADGSFSVSVTLTAGSNSVYLKTFDGTTESDPTATITVDYTSPASPQVSYTYDKVNRLTVADYGAGQTLSYGYDDGGNVLTVTAVSAYFAVAGRVTDNAGAALAGVAVVIGGLEATTDPSGYYQAVGLAAGSYSVRATLAGYTFPITPVSVDAVMPSAFVDVVAQ